ncbi:MAG TPA: hypothetical protein VER96_03345 [Polyangiaceae bacterium]|nr:hypothetical protein [Polyangiaceae bacterium]
MKVAYFDQRDGMERMEKEPDPCGTTLFYFLKPTRHYTMSVGAFDDPSPFRLVREIFIDRKPNGYAFVGDHERWTESETFDRLTPP